MTTQLSPLPVFRAWDNLGLPLVGGKLFTYVAGTTTKQATFTDSTGGTPNTNPVILNYRGEANIWLDPTKVYKLVLAPSTDTDPPTNPFWTVDQISGGSLSPSGSIIPTVDNLFTLGNTSFSWANVYVGPNHAPVLDPVSGNIGYYARTAAEISAGVTPTNFSYPPLDGRRYGAKFDGATDDTIALTNLELVAFAAGASITLPQGTTLYNGKWSVRVSVLGYGTILKQNRSTVDSTFINGVINAAVSGITIEGLTLDGALKSTGVTGTSVNNVTLLNVSAQNCLNMGFAFILSDNVNFVNCRAKAIQYYQTGIAGASADGFYLGGCTRSHWIACRAEDVRRIGFVSEQNSGVKSDLIKGIACTTFNTNHCDDSTTEFNAAFWAENTNSVDWIDCVGYGIAGNAGQTSGRVTGMILLGGGNNAAGTIRAVRCSIYGTNGTIPGAGLQVVSANSGADVLIQDCLLSQAATGVLSSATMNSLTIQRLRLSSIVNVNSAQAGVILDGTAQSLGSILIDGISADNCTFDANSGTVLIFAAPTGCKYTLRNLRGAQHVMRSQVDRLSVYDCEIACGSTSFSSFLGTTVEFHDCILTSRNSSNTDYICAFGQLNNNSKVLFHGGEITGFGAGWNPVMGGTNIDLTVEGTRIDNYVFNLQTQGTFLNKFDDCRFYNVPVTNGTIKTNGGGAATKQTLIVQDCYFRSNNAADTPIVVNINQPTKSILHGNVFDTATLLFTITPTSQVNNIAV